MRGRASASGSLHGTLGPLAHARARGETPFIRQAILSHGADGHNAPHNLTYIRCNFRDTTEIAFWTGKIARGAGEIPLAATRAREARRPRSDARRCECLRHGSSWCASIRSAWPYARTTNGLCRVLALSWTLPSRALPLSLAAMEVTSPAHFGLCSCGQPLLSAGATRCPRCRAAHARSHIGRRAAILNKLPAKAPLAWETKWVAWNLGVGRPDWVNAPSRTAVSLLEALKEDDKLRRAFWASFFKPRPARRS
jgi:hypothetical protein